MSLPSVRDHTAAVISALEDLGLTVGNAGAPEGAEPPFASVYHIPGGTSTGTLERPEDDASLFYQVTCVGLTAEQAEYVADKALLLVDATLSVSGRRVLRVSLEMYGGVARDDTGDPTHYIATPRFRVLSTPSA